MVGGLSRAYEEALLLAGDLRRDDHPGLHFCCGGRLRNRRILEQMRELGNAAFQLRLLFTGGLVAAVLSKVSLVARRFDLARDLGAADGGHLLKLGPKALVRFW